MDNPVTPTTAPAALTPSQTIGPFSHEAWRWAVAASSTPATGVPALRITGVVYDGDAQPVNDAVVEAWLPDAAPAEAGTPLPGFRRMPSDDQGRFAFTIPVPLPAAAGAPVMYVTVFARGLVQHQFTAVFLEDDPKLAESAILAQVPAARRATLIARKQPDGSYAWDIWLQTARETVFFDYQ